MTSVFKEEEEAPGTCVHRRQPSGSRREKAAPSAPWSWTSSLQKWKKINFCCVRHPVCVSCYDSRSRLIQHVFQRIVAEPGALQVSDKGWRLSLHHRSRGRVICLMETSLHSEADHWGHPLCRWSLPANHLECTHCLARTPSALDKMGKITTALSTLQATTFLFVLVITTNPFFTQIFLNRPQPWNISSTTRTSFKITLNNQEVT